MHPLAELTYRLRAKLRRRGASADDAEDIVQEALLRFEQYPERHNVREAEGFLTRTAFNIAIDQGRAARRSRIVPTPPDGLPDFPDGSAGPDEVLEAGSRLKRLSAGISSLSPRTRRILLAQRVDGQSYADIAATEGISVSAVEKHIAKAVLLLTEWMKDD